ncbi:MAG: thioesterase domain-containing protein [Rhodococcus sp. (in: high G+C Gram-positive bacteria)]
MTVITDSTHFNALHLSAPDIVDRSASDVVAPTIVPIRASGASAPVFCIHPIDGLASRYAALAEHIGFDHPVYGVQIAGAGERAVSIGALAARYADDILVVATAGPVHLLGLAFGGVLAHAIAVELQGRGVTVLSVTLLASDPMPRDGSGCSIRQQHELLAGMGDDIDRSRAEELLAAAAHNENLASKHFPGIYVGTALVVSNIGSDAGSAWHAFVSGTVSKFEVPDTAAFGLVGALVDRYL